MDILGLNLLFNGLKILFSTLLLSNVLFFLYQYVYFYGNATMNLIKYHVFKKYSSEEIQYFLKHNKIKENHKIEKITKLLEKSKFKITKKNFVSAYKMQDICLIKNNQYIRINFNSGRVYKHDLKNEDAINQLYLYFWQYYDNYFFKVIKENKDDRIKKFMKICDIDDYLSIKEELDLKDITEEKTLLDKKRSLSILLMNDMLKFSAILLKETYTPQKYWSSSSIDMMSDMVLNDRHKKIDKNLIIKEKVH